MAVISRNNPNSVKSTTRKFSPCPCGSKKYYAQCCGPLHNGAAARDAEALMRSRYCAFALGLDDYILRSWHDSTQPATLNSEGDVQRPRWIGLRINRHDSIDAEHARVEFIARYKINGRAFTLHEISRFVRENGHWFYIDGDLL